MCEECVKEQFPDRGSVCLDSGVYLANLAGCRGCGHKDTLREANKTVTPAHSDQEIIQFDHVCGGCGHVVAQHTHTFCLEEDYQLYEMSCLLCGEAEDSRSCLPHDPRFETTLF